MTQPQRRMWVVAYDIADDLDRARVAAVLARSGLRLQRSVFQVAPDDLDAALADVAQLVDLDHDVVQAFRQCRDCRDQQRDVGQAGPSLRDHWWIA